MSNEYILTEDAEGFKKLLEVLDIMDPVEARSVRRAWLGRLPDRRTLIGIAGVSTALRNAAVEQFLFGYCNV